MNTNTTATNIDDLDIRIRFDGESDDNYAYGMKQTLDMLPDINAWLAELDDAAAVELAQANSNDEWRYGKPKYSTCEIRITDDDGNTWEGEASA